MVAARLCRIDRYAHDHPKSVGYIGVAAGEHSLAPAPRFVFGAMPDTLTHSMFGGTALEPVGCYVLRDATLGYDAVLFHERTALCALALNHAEDYVTHVLNRGLGADDGAAVRRISGSAVCIFGPGYNVYGHWLVDFLPRLHVLSRAGYDLARLRFVLPHDCPVFAFNLLGSIGVSAEQLVFYDHVAERVQFDELVVPTNLRTGGRLHSLFASATRGWVNRVLPDESDGSPVARLFVSRALTRSERNLGNRAVIEQLARAAGLEIVHPETLSPQDQIALFRGARQVVGEYGSGLHATIFGSGSLHCCALRGTSHWLGFIQSSLAGAFGQSVSYVFGHAEAHAVTYDFEVEPENFRRALRCLELELHSQ